MKFRFVILFLFLLPGCFVGKNVAKYPPALTAAGASTTATLVDKTVIEGELLSATSGALHVLSAGSIYRIGMAEINLIKLSHRARIIRVNNDRLLERQVDILRPVSRFPAGIPPAVLEEMLSDLQQEEVLELRAGD